MKIENLPTLKVFHFDRFYCFTREEDLAPSFDGYGRTIYVLAPNATILEPPEGEGQVAVHDPDRRVWFLAESHRGETWFNHKGEPIVIERPGNPADFGLTPTWQLRQQP